MNEAPGNLLNRFADSSGWPIRLALLLTGGGIAMGQAPFSLPGLAFPALCLAIFLGVATIGPRQAAWRGGLIGAGFAVVTFFWIVEPFLVDIGRHGWMAPFALALTAVLGGIFWGGAFWAARRLTPHGPGARALTLAVFLSLSELLRSYVLTGFPWGLSAYIWIDTPIYQFASLVGPHGVTLGTLLLAWAVVLSLLRRNWSGIFACAVGMALAWWGGTELMATSTPAPGQIAGGARPVIRLVQPNASQREKWDPEMIPVFYNRQLNFTGEPAAVTPDLTIWPEVAVAFLLNDPSAPFHEIAAAAGGGPVILGGQQLRGRRAFNSLAVLGPDGRVEQTYDKHHLVPFGEYIPGEWLFSRVGLKAMTAKYGFGYSPGPGPRVLDLGALGRVLPLICYESIFPQEMRRVSERPDWMLILTNDAWFGESLGPYQHLMQAKARAIEFALPMVRVANTGVSAVFDGKGRMVDSLPLGVSGFMDATLTQPLIASLYWKIGDKPVLFVMIVLGVCAVWLSHRKQLTGA